MKKMMERMRKENEEVERCFEEFYEDVHTEFLKFGEVVNFKVRFYYHTMCVCVCVSFTCEN